MGSYHGNAIRLKIKKDAPSEQVKRRQKELRNNHNKRKHSYGFS